MGKVVLITGASSGIGKATAEKFIKQRHIVYGVARRTKLMKDLEKLGGHSFYMDVRDDQSVKDGVAKVLKEQGRIDILVNNAGYAQYGPLEDVTVEQAKAQFETNVFGYARTVKQVLPHMRAQKSGVIINVTSSAGKISLPMVTWYGASKFALEGLMDALRGEVSLFNVKVVIIEPGFINTEIYEVAWKFLAQVKTSQVYQEIQELFVKDFEKRKKTAPGPEIIADKIYEAALSAHPQTRYVLPTDVRIYLFLKRFLSDKIIDKLIMKTPGVKQSKTSSKL